LPGKKFVSKRETDILLIRKYLNGELNTKAMHQLERRAQDDPFLMDALEGYDKAGDDQKAQLNELDARLKKRITFKENRIMPWWIMGIAASVLIICSVGIWWLNNDRIVNNAPKKAELTKLETQTAPTAPLTAMPPSKSIAAPTAPVTTAAPSKPMVAVLKKMPRTSMQARNSAGQKSEGTFKPRTIVADEVVNANIKDSVAKDTTPLNEAIVMEYTAPKKKSAAKSVTGKPDTNTDKLLQGQAAGVAANNTPASHSANGTVYQDKVPLKEIVISKKKEAYAKASIKGRVVAKDDGLPLPGVTVRVPGTNISTQTDANGRFNLSVDSTKTKLVVAYIGYQTLEVNTRNRDSVKTIALQPSSSSLNEVVVTGYTSKNGDETVVIDAHPRDGWSSYRKYLKENAVSPDSQTGIVKLSFMVGRNGTVSGIIIKKGLSAATNQKAIDLINNGPAWVGNTNKEPEKVSLRVKFGK
jgi:hypothetical protein